MNYHLPPERVRELLGVKAPPQKEVKPAPKPAAAVPPKPKPEPAKPSEDVAIRRMADQVEGFAKHILRLEKCPHCGRKHFDIHPCRPRLTAKEKAA
jgi:hypothetical protein